MVTSVIISSGVTSTGLVIKKEEALYVESGGTAVDTVINGGEEYVYAGAVDSGGHLPKNGYVNVYGSVVDQVVNGGFENVLSGGKVTDVLIKLGEVDLEKGAKVDEVRLSGSGGLESGYLFVGGGGRASDVRVLSDGFLEVTDGGKASDIRLSSGGQILLEDRGVVPNVTVGSGASLDAFPSTEVSDAFLKSGSTLSLRGAQSSQTVLSSGSAEVVSDASVAMHTVLNQDASLTLSSGTSAQGVFLRSGGELYLGSGHGEVTRLSLKAGALIDLEAQSATSASISGGELIVTSGATVLESFTLIGQTSGLKATVTPDGGSGALLTVSEAASDALVGAAAAFPGRGAPATRLDETASKLAVESPLASFAKHMSA